LIDDEGPGFISGLFCVLWNLYKDCLRSAEEPQEGKELGPLR